jgi:hypothetical protein
MDGVIDVPAGRIAPTLKQALTSVKLLRSLGPYGRKLISGGSPYHLREYYKTSETIRVLQRCLELEKEFRVVRRDETCIRKVKVVNERFQVDVPLIFVSQIPAKSMVSFTKRIRRDHMEFDVKISSQVPVPPQEALSLLSRHKAKFDYTEVWWVPNDILVEKLPDPDPIIVGAIRFPQDKRAYFEIYRWVDTTVESEYWSKEAY